MNAQMHDEDRYGLDVYAKRDLTLVRGENALVWDDAGRVYIDCVAGHGTMNVGHGNPAVVAAIGRQAERLVACSNTFYNDVRGAFMARLAELAPAGVNRVFLCNSGAEAVEAAMKFARLSTGKSDFIAAVRGFHGRTLGALSATHNPAYRDGCGPLVPGVSFVPFNDIQKLAAAVTDQTAGILLEIVQGEGGVQIGSPEFFRAAAGLCRDKGILLIIDEVQTGFCRTGRMFALEHFDLQPDMVCLAKSIAGGLPMGAVLCSSAVRVPQNKHGSTFGGNPLSCAAALAAVDYMVETNLADQAARKGEHLGARLKSIRQPRIREVRQLGLMIGIELRQRSKPYLAHLQDEGVLALPAGPNVIRLLPPLTIEPQHLDTVAEAIERVLSREE
jgi:acetylornithine/LysW-gamma-L-lysine aminotransferase